MAKLLLLSGLVAAVALSSSSSSLEGARLVTHANAAAISPADLANAALLMSNLTGAFEVFKQLFAKQYSSTAAEKASYNNFISNLAESVGLQATNPLATFGVTPFSDLSTVEFANMYLNQNAPTYYAPNNRTEWVAADGTSSHAEAAAGTKPKTARRKMDAHGLPVKNGLYTDDKGNVQLERHETPFEELPEVFHHRVRREKAAALELVKKEKQQHAEAEAEAAKGREGASPAEPVISEATVAAYRKAFAAQNELPDTFNWAHYGVLTPVRYQGECGACWAFVVSGSIESQWALAGYGLPVLSVQQLVSCDNTNNACAGGVMQYAFQWILRQNNGFVALEEYYPYVTFEKTTPPACDNVGAGAGAKLSNYIDVPRTEAQIRTYVANVGPVVVAIEAYGWQHYTGGIMTDCNNLMTTHAVLVVGYDAKNDPPYWILKNSWSTEWGEKGYMRLRMGTNACLIANNPSIAVVPSSYDVSELPVGDPARRVTRNGASTTFTMTAATVSAAAVGLVSLFGMLLGGI